MKKILLILSVLAISVGSLEVSAQSYSVASGSNDTTRGNYDGTDVMVVNNNVKSTSGNVVLKWHSTGVILAPNWTFTGVCDNHNCRTAAQSMNINYSDKYSTTADVFDANFAGLKAAANGSFSVCYVSVSDTGNTTVTSRNLVFIGYKNVQGVKQTIVSDDEITMFPNPAREAINIIFDQNAGIKSIAIFNLIGKTMNVYKPTDNGSAKLDLSNVPSGVYFVRLMNGQGQVVATRRFTKQ